MICVLGVGTRLRDWSVNARMSGMHKDSFYLLIVYLSRRGCEKAHMCIPPAMLRAHTWQHAQAPSLQYSTDGQAAVALQALPPAPTGRRSKRRKGEKALWGKGGSTVAVLVSPHLPRRTERSTLIGCIFGEVFWQHLGPSSRMQRPHIAGAPLAASMREVS